MATLRASPLPAASLIFDISVDRRSGVPMYIQISDGIRALIEQKTLTSGRALPPSRLVCEHFGVTRMTLRQAYAVLQHEGLIDSERGRGTFVNQPQHARHLPRMVGFSEEMRSAGRQPSSQVISFRKERPDAAARNFFGISDDEFVWRILRLRLADRTPMAIEEVVLPEALAPGLDGFDLNSESLYELLEGSFGRELGHCDQIIAARIPSSKQRKLLGMSSRFAILEVTRQSYGRDGEPVTLGITRYRGDMYNATVHAERDLKRD